MEIALAISELAVLLERLNTIHPAEQSRGRCLAQGDWGRCYSSVGHDGDHDFPSEAHRDMLDQISNKLVD